MTRVIELIVWAMLLAATPAVAQTRPQTPPPPPPGVPPQPVGRGGTTAAGEPGSTVAPPTRPAAAQPARQPTPTATPTSRSTAPAPAPAVRTPDVAPTSLLPLEPTPTEAQLGVPIYPGATFLRSYDAGQGQRYYLFGSTAGFGELVLFYKTALKKNGDVVYDEPPVHMFEVGRFREETMAFPPGVTVKDYTWGGSKGYLVPTPGANPSRFPTVIQIVPVTAANR